MQPEIRHAHHQVRKVVGEIARLRRRVQTKPRHAVSPHTIETLRLLLKAAIKRRRDVRLATSNAATVSSSLSPQLDPRPPMPVYENSAAEADRGVPATPKIEVSEDVVLAETSEHEGDSLDWERRPWFAPSSL